MIHGIRAAVAMSVVCFVIRVVVAAEPAGTAVPIGAANAQRLVPVGEVKMRAHRIVRGPGVGELTILDSGQSVEIVRDSDLRTLRSILKVRQPVDIGISPDGKRVAWNERYKSSYWIENTESGERLELDTGPNPGGVAFSPDGKWIAIGTMHWSEAVEGDGYAEICLYDLTGRLIRTLERARPGYLRPVFSPDGKTLMEGNRNDVTRLFDVPTGKLLQTFHGKMTQDNAFSPDGKRVAAGYVDGTFAIWDVATGARLHQGSSGCRETYSVDWSPRGDLLVTSGDAGPVTIWETKTFAKVRELAAPIWVIQARFTADGSRLLVSSSSDVYAKQDRKVTLWAIPDGGRKLPD
ncbi:MAG: WD40 repeat domain-containing protein [Planctomycetes bacterium]|nr:WD40 repeat domain-containing protein [Planctomycetota bacterium]